MTIEIPVSRLALKAAVALVTLGTCALLVSAIVSNFIVGVLTDERVEVSCETLIEALNYFPNSARLHGRIAQVTAQGLEPKYAEFHALSAVNLSPYNYRFRLLLASIEESNGKLSAAEQSLREGLALAPNKAEAHWQLANLLLREGKLGLSIDEFRAANRKSKRLLPVTFNLIWRASGEDRSAVEALASDEPSTRLALARFLLKQSRADEAANVFNQIERNSRLSSPNGMAFLNALLSSGRLELARATWARSISEGSQNIPLIWNGSFEYDITKELAQFDWAIGRSDYAKFKIATGEAHTGTRSLRIDFSGRDTTRLGGEIKQLIVIHPGTRYRLECYAKADQLITSEGPRVMVTTNTSSDWKAISEPIIAGRPGWQRLSIEFASPVSMVNQPPALYVTIYRKPNFSYDEPTRGTVWFDDFTLTEVKEDR